MKEEFKNLYNEVFDNNGKVKNCGREKCKKLILICEKMDPNTIYGNKNTGFMDIDKILNLYKNL